MTKHINERALKRLALLHLQALLPIKPVVADLYDKADVLRWLQQFVLDTRACLGASQCDEVGVPTITAAEPLVSPPEHARVEEVVLTTEGNSDDDMFEAEWARQMADDTKAVLAPNLEFHAYCETNKLQKKVVRQLIDEKLIATHTNRDGDLVFDRPLDGVEMKMVADFTAAL